MVSPPSGIYWKCIPNVMMAHARIRRQLENRQVVGPLFGVGIDRARIRRRDLARGHGIGPEVVSETSGLIRSRRRTRSGSGAGPGWPQEFSDAPGAGLVIYAYQPA